MFFYRMDYFNNKQYGAKASIDSIYAWAFEEIERSTTLGDFYKIILQITDFEGSLHNNTTLPKAISH